MKNIYDLKGKKVLLTGANGRLGQVYAVALLTSGAFVYVSDIQDAINPALESVMKGNGLTQYEYIKVDVTSEESLHVAESHIGTAVDVLINNAGAKGVKGPFETRKVEDIDAVHAVHIKGTILCSKIFSEKMIVVKKGKIINIASIYGMVAPDKKIYDDPAKINSEVYGATKAGVIQLTKYFAAYLGEYGITANCISPGGVFHDGQSTIFVKNYCAKTPLGRMASPEDLTDIVCFLSSDGSNYISGQNIAVDGGFTS